MNTSADPTEGRPIGKTWTVQIDISEHEGTTRAVAHLSTPGGASLSGTGVALLNPSDSNVPEIGDELATARALSQLAHVVLEAAADDISGALHKPVHLTS